MPKNRSEVLLDLVVSNNTAEAILGLADALTAPAAVRHYAFRSRLAPSSTG